MEIFLSPLTWTRVHAPASLTHFFLVSFHPKSQPPPRFNQMEMESLGPLF